MTAPSTPPSRTADGSGRARGSRVARNVWSGALFGLGFAAFVDETVFHQLLHWHHFYDLGSPELGLVSDGVFHAVGWFAAIGGLFLFADLRRRGALEPLRWTGAVLLGAGAFQLYDGTVQHKLLGLHQIRYVDDLLPYDLIWNTVAAVLILAGAVLLVRARTAAALGREAS
ncbi:DUF2243 domain-containing protein [Rathayibacter festucae DSM 15932]|uniref:DUF2243 domain-containing protein n=1 Tax=Rathayibacter festucae DSM 15932 TaxID=1328866 RepID=A0A3T0SYC8_9MICO|nr:DUF2243 domain-containing protein [Rathayibacter festucae]AZZ51467.1 DUF2243 domain-containing protein [Rathayibacter festucae DSM 15932]